MAMQGAKCFPKFCTDAGICACAKCDDQKQCANGECTGCIRNCPTAEELEERYRERYEETMRRKGKMTGE